jgi:hypothetical protein
MSYVAWGIQLLKYMSVKDFFKTVPHYYATGKCIYSYTERGFHLHKYISVDPFKNSITIKSLARVCIILTVNEVLRFLALYTSSEYTDEYELLKTSSQLCKSTMHI